MDGFGDAHPPPLPLFFAFPRAIWQAAISPEALKVMLIGVCISVPVTAGYTVFSRWMFRGKTSELRCA